MIRWTFNGKEFDRNPTTFTPIPTKDVEYKKTIDGQVVRIIAPRNSVERRYEMTWQGLSETWRNLLHDWYTHDETITVQSHLRDNPRDTWTVKIDEFNAEYVLGSIPQRFDVSLVLREVKPVNDPIISLEYGAEPGLMVIDNSTNLPISDVQIFFQADTDVQKPSVTQYYRNLLTNPDFERNFESWENTNAVWEVDPIEYATGSKAVKTRTMNSPLAQTVYFPPNEYLTVLVMLKGVDVDVEVGAEFLDFAGTVLVRDSHVFRTHEEWEWYWFTTNSPSPAETRQVRLYVQKPGERIKTFSTIFSASNPSPAESGYEYFVEEEGDFGVGPFSIDIPNLEPNTTYYIRAFAYNSRGYSYGDEITFVTGESKSPVEGSATVSASGDVAAWAKIGSVVSVSSVLLGWGEVGAGALVLQSRVYPIGKISSSSTACAYGAIEKPQVIHLYAMGRVIASGIVVRREASSHIYAMSRAYASDWAVVAYARALIVASAAFAVGVERAIWGRVTASANAIGSAIGERVVGACGEAHGWASGNASSVTSFRCAGQLDATARLSASSLSSDGWIYLDRALIQIGRSNTLPEWSNQLHNQLCYEGILAGKHVLRLDTGIHRADIDGLRNVNNSVSGEYFYLPVGKSLLVFDQEGDANVKAVVRFNSQWA